MCPPATVSLRKANAGGCFFQYIARIEVLHKAEMADEPGLIRLLCSLPVWFSIVQHLLDLHVSKSVVYLVDLITRQQWHRSIS